MSIDVALRSVRCNGVSQKTMRQQLRELEASAVIGAGNLVTWEAGRRSMPVYGR